MHDDCDLCAICGPILEHNHHITHTCDECDHITHMCGESDPIPHMCDEYDHIPHMCEKCDSES